MAKTFKIGTRGSPLALAQAHDVRDRLIAAHADLTMDTVEVIIIKVSGDAILDRHLMNAGGKGLFTKEIEEALLDGDIDCAVHSSKDMPTQLPEGLELSTFLKREDARDAFISAKYKSLDDLPEGATVGTASLRRRALALRVRPDLNVITFRGNVQTRLRKLNEGQADATFLAQAGLNRLGMADAATDTLSLEDFPPAPAQGAVTIEIKTDDDAARSRLAPLHCTETAIAVTAERAFLAALDGSCRTPIAALATLDKSEISLSGMLLSLDGTLTYESAGTAPIAEAANLGTQIGMQVKEAAGSDFFTKLTEEVKAVIE